MTASAMWLNTTFYSFDLSVTLLIHKLYEHMGWLFSPLSFVLHYLGSPAGMIILLLFLLFFVRRARPFIYSMIVSALIGLIITNLFIKTAVARPRPYADELSAFHQLWLQMGSYMESDLSFPSGHTTGVFAIMVPVFILGDKRKSWLALVYALLMGISRIYIVVHYPTDVVAGIIAGTFSGVLGVLIARHFPQSWYEYDWFRRKPKRETKKP